MKTFEKKLMLNKVTIASISDQELSQIEGGSGVWCKIGVWLGTNIAWDALCQAAEYSWEHCAENYGNFSNGPNGTCLPYSQMTNCTRNNLC